MSDQQYQGQKINEGDNVVFTVQEINKGGFISQIDEYHSFLPISELDPVNHPRLKNVPPDKVVDFMQGYLDQSIMVSIIDIDHRKKRMKVSERHAKKKIHCEPEAGEVVEGEVTGVSDYGIFISFDGREELIHRSEISWGYISDLSDIAGIGDEVKALVIGKNEGKLKLSIKRLTRDPWEKAEESFPVGTIIMGTVTSKATFGAFIQVADGVSGLLHSSCISIPLDEIEKGQKIKVRVKDIEPDNNRMGLEAA